MKKRGHGSQPANEGGETGQMAWDNDSIEVKLQSGGIGRGTILCRFRSKADTLEALYETVRGVNGSFTTSCSRYPGASFWYQLGVDLPALAMPAWGPWIEARY